MSGAAPPPPPPGILTLPQHLLERILLLAAGGRRGAAPFAAWTTLPAVHRDFRCAFYAAVTRVALRDAYAAPAARYTSLLAYAAAPARLLAGPVAACRRLRALDLHGCDSLEDTDIAAFAARCSILRELALTVCRGQTDAAVLALSRASPELRRVDVAGCDRHRHSAAVLASGEGGEEATREARLASTQRHEPCKALTNLSVVALTMFCYKLRSVTLSNAPHITDAALLSISGLPELTVVVLRRLLAITDAGVRALVSGPARITSLSLFSNSTLGDDALRAITHGRATASSLAFFGISFSFNVSDAGLCALVAGVPTLDELQVDHCGQVTDSWMRSAERGGGLTRVSLRNVGLMLTSRGVCDLARAGACAAETCRLVAINLGFVSTVNTELLRQLRAAAPQLEVLVLDACGSVDDDSARVIAGFECLRVLDLSWCSKLSSDGIAALCNGVVGARLERLSIGPIPLPEEVAADAAAAAAAAADVAAAAAAAAAVGDGGGNAFPAGAGDGGAQWPPPQWLGDGVAGNNGEGGDAEGGIEDEGDSDGNEQPANDGEEAEEAAMPALLEYFGDEAGELGNALDLVVHEVSDDEEPLAAAFQASLRRGYVENRDDVVDATLYEVGRKCTALRELALSGDVSAAAIAWLTKNTTARIEYLDMQTGISSSIYEDDNEPDTSA